MNDTKPSLNPREDRSAWWILIALAVATFVMRLVPHPLNFTPLGALALFAGARMRWWNAISIPLLVMVISDLVLWRMREHFTPFNPYVFGSVGLYVLLGRWIRNRKSVFAIGGACLAGGLLFFLVTNFGVWLGVALEHGDKVPEGAAYVMGRHQQYNYPMRCWALSWKGLAACYLYAVPFYRSEAFAPPLGFLGNQLFADVFFTGIAFGAYFGLVQGAQKRRPAVAHQQNNQE